MKIITEKEFENEVKEGLVLVDFFATWCGPCRMMSMILEEIEEEIKDKVKILKVDVDENENLARRFGIMSIPTLMVFKNGELVKRETGLRPKNAIFDLMKD